MYTKNNIYDPKTDTVFWEEVLKIPEFITLKNTPQNIVWHTEGSAFEHTRMVTQCMLEHIKNDDNLLFSDYDYKTILVFSALLHDIGKGVTTELGNDNLYHCHYHAIKGAEITEQLLAKYSLISSTFKQSVISLVRYHMQPLYIFRGDNVNKHILSLANKLNSIDFESLLLLKQCDCEGSVPEKEYNYIKTLDNVRSLYYKICSYSAGTKVQLEKVENLNDTYKSLGHPNNINVGYTANGILTAPISIGFRVHLGFTFSTSPVKEIINKNYFKTQNSLYKITQI